jgi:uncharacterized membrane protein
MLYLVLKWIHILAAVAALGTNITYGAWLSLAAREEKALSFALRGIQWLDRRLANPSYGVLLITGLLMVLVGRLPLTLPWLIVALILYVATALLGILVYAPLMRRQVQLAATAGPASPEYQATASRSLRLGLLTTGIVAVIVFLMVVKPALW